MSTLPRRRTVAVDLGHIETGNLNGRRVEPGTELSVSGITGRVRFRYFDRTGIIVATDGRGRSRSIRPDRVKTVHRTTKMRETT